MRYLQSTLYTGEPHPITEPSAHSVDISAS
jgi:hypothetical protein